MLGKVAAAPAVASVISPYSARGAAQVSRDGQIAYATVVFDAPQASLPVPDVTRVVHLAEAARAPGVQVDIGGPAVENALRPSVGISAAVGVVAAAIVLFIAFGSLLAMLLPLAVAIAALVSGLMTAGLLSHAVSIPSAGPTLGILIGLGVGIDYALFIVTRHRNNLKAGMSPRDAAVRRAEHLRAGRSCSPAPRCASPCSGCSCCASATSPAWASPRRSPCCSRWPPPPPCCPRCSASSACGSCPAGNAAGWPPTGPRPTAQPGCVDHGWPRSCSATPPRWPPPPPP